MKNNESWQQGYEAALTQTRITLWIAGLKAGLDENFLQEIFVKFDGNPLVEMVIRAAKAKGQTEVQGLQSSKEAVVFARYQSAVALHSAYCTLKSALNDLSQISPTVEADLEALETSIKEMERELNTLFLLFV